MVYLENDMKNSNTYYFINKERKLTKVIISYGTDKVSFKVSRYENDNWIIADEGGIKSNEIHALWKDTGDVSFKDFCDDYRFTCGKLLMTKEEFIDTCNRLSTQPVYTSFLIDLLSNNNQEEKDKAIQLCLTYKDIIEKEGDD